MDKGDLFRLMYLIIGPLAMLSVGAVVYWVATRKPH